MNELKVTVYTTPECPYCKMVEKLLDDKGINYEEKNVAEDDKAAKEMIKKSDQMGVPVTDLGGEIIVGFNKPKIKKALGKK